MKACNIRKTTEGLINYMKKHGYTGLVWPGECGCSIDDIAPCGCPIKEVDCRLGYEIPSDNPEYDFMVTIFKPKPEPK